jgi:hypothetical protein
MIQHNRYSDEALDWIEPRLGEYLEKRIPPRQIVNRMAKDSDQHRRKWKVLRQFDAPALPAIAWSVTIGDIAPRSRDPEKYSDAVTQWARAVLGEM